VPSIVNVPRRAGRNAANASCLAAVVRSPAWPFRGEGERGTAPESRFVGVADHAAYAVVHVAAPVIAYAPRSLPCALRMIDAAASVSACLPASGPIANSTSAVPATSVSSVTWRLAVETRPVGPLRPL